jgi:alpha-L-fucosidase
MNRREAGRNRMPKTALTLLIGLLFTTYAGAQSYEQRVEASKKVIDEVAAKGPFAPSWKSLEAYKVPLWYLDAKFGIFIHWGVYSVPAFDSEWYARNMYVEGNTAFGHHISKYGSQSRFGYKDFIPMFTAANFDPDAWAELFRKSGAKYVVPVAEHHDGFPMYDCSFSEWSAVKMGPKFDIIGELAKAIRKQGLHFGVSTHRAEHWWFFNGGTKFDSDVKDPRYRGLYGPARPEESQPDNAYLDDWLVRTAELVDKYEPELIWFDWWIEQPKFQPYLQKFAAFYYNRGAQWKRGVVVNAKKKAFPERAAVLDIERGKLDTIHPFYWQTDTSISEKSWGYVSNDEFKTTDSIIDDLVDIVSKNGALLLNIGPRPDGTIPQEAEKILLEIGRWLSVNGEAIYGTRPWKVYREGPTKVVSGALKDAAGKPLTGKDIRFTTKGDTLYVIALSWPKQRKLVIKSLAAGAKATTRPIQKVELLGSEAGLKWARNAAGLIIDLPRQKTGDFAYAFKIWPVGGATEDR